jgi:sugar lactone lactonase YvrE
LAVPEPVGPLRYPGSALIDGERLYVSDTGHHRVLELLSRSGTLRADIVRVFGTGRPGLIDGAADVASFRGPQGLAVHDGRLYVGDRANHALRSIDLATGEVTTIAGTGAMADGSTQVGPARQTALRSPWGMAAVGDGLYVAMAGSHQIWRFDIPSAGLRPFAGGGGESIADGSGAQSLLAQPMGISAGHGSLAFCDAESSAVRTVTVDSKAEVRTVVGTGLFDFGDTDGAGDDARLQHVEGLAWVGSGLVVADTYNDKLKLVNPLSRSCRSMPGEAGSGRCFNHPTGVAWNGERLVVADTDAHRIAVVDLSSGAVSTLEIT